MIDDIEPTLGEVFRGLGRIERVVEDGFRRVDERFDGLDDKFVPRELYEAELGTIRDQIKKAGADRRYWITTTVSGLALLAAFVLPFVR